VTRWLPELLGACTAEFQATLFVRRGKRSGYQAPCSGMADAAIKIARQACST